MFSSSQKSYALLLNHQWVFYLKILAHQRSTCSNSLPNNFLDSPKLKEFANYNFNFTRMAESSQNGLKTLWEKEKLLIMSNFSFSDSVFNSLPNNKIENICRLQNKCHLIIKICFWKDRKHFGKRRNFEIVICKLFQFGRVQIFLFEKGLCIYYSPLSQVRLQADGGQYFMPLLNYLHIIQLLDLTHSHKTKFGPDQIESICRRQIKRNKNDNFCLW